MLNDKKNLSTQKFDFYHFKNKESDVMYLQ